jgi:hypothetical protein
MLFDEEVSIMNLVLHSRHAAERQDVGRIYAGIIEESNMTAGQEIVNKSGFPFQLLLEKLITSSPETRNWRIIAKEHRWVNAETGEEKYIDLLLERESLPIRFVVECKRISGNWYFLMPGNPFNTTPNTKLFSVDYHDFQYSWKDRNLYPESQEAKYCVMETDGKRDNRMLEKIAGETLLSLEYFAREDTKVMKSTIERLGISNSIMYYLPIIVTTANLNDITFNRAEIDIETGNISESDSKPIKFIRFRKNLSTSIEYKLSNSAITSIDQLNSEYDRTVFIVQAKSFIELLSLINSS